MQGVSGTPGWNNNTVPEIADFGNSGLAATIQGRWELTAAKRVTVVPFLKLPADSDDPNSSVRKTEFSCKTELFVED